MENFTPASAALGGLLIGLSAALLWVAKGRIAGISGILGGLGAVRPGDVAWRAAFLVGLMAAPLLYGAAGGPLPQSAWPASPATLIVAGLLVGFGTRLGSGCTSGHGVPGAGLFVAAMLAGIGAHDLMRSIRMRRAAAV